MWTTARPSLRWAAIFFYIAHPQVSTAANQPFLDQGFSFDYTPSAAPVPIPTTTQCEEIPLNWGPGPFNGPSPVAPYYIQVYTSTFLFPMVINVGEGRTFNWPVPYVPGTQYQVCMFAQNGVTGGCQRQYTVIPAPNTTLDNPPVCQNLTYPQSILNVAASDHTGDLSQYAWVDQCTDISLRPLNGTPPFTMTIASTLHPPWNITSNDMSAINWTVQLSWSSAFWISLVDSEGLSWAYGPLHSGGNGPTDCLSLVATTTKKGGISESVAVGSGIGGLAIGALAGAVIAWLALRRRRSAYHNGSEDRIHSMAYKDEGFDSSQYAAVPVTTTSPRESHADLLSAQRSRSAGRVPMLPGTGYEVEPFRLPEAPSSDIGSQNGENSSEPVTSRQSNMSHAQRRPSSAGSSGPRSPGTSGSAMPHVYVVHHDGGRAPVSVYTPEGTEVIELPPRYHGGSPSPSPNPGRQQERRPPLSLHNSSNSAGPLPRKLPRSPANEEEGGEGSEMMS